MNRSTTDVHCYTPPAKPRQPRLRPPVMADKTEAGCAAIRHPLSRNTHIRPKQNSPRDEIAETRQSYMHKRPFCGHRAPVLAVNPANRVAPAACVPEDLHRNKALPASSRGWQRLASVIAMRQRKTQQRVKVPFIADSPRRRRRLCPRPRSCGRCLRRCARRS